MGQASGLLRLSEPHARVYDSLLLTVLAGFDSAGFESLDLDSEASAGLLSDPLESESVLDSDFESLSAGLRADPLA